MLEKTTIIHVAVKTECSITFCPWDEVENDTHISVCSHDMFIF